MSGQEVDPGPHAYRTSLLLSLSWTSSLKASCTQNFKHTQEEKRSTRNSLRSIILKVTFIHSTSQPTSSSYHHSKATYHATRICPCQKLTTYVSKSNTLKSKCRILNKALSSPTSSNLLFLPVSLLGIPSWF